MNVGGSDALETFVPLVFKRRGIQRLAETGTPAHDTTIIEAVGRALYWQQLLDTGSFVSGSAIARTERLHRTSVNKLLRLPLLAPDIIARLMAGRQPRRLTLVWLMHNTLPVDWESQRRIIDSFE